MKTKRVEFGGETFEVPAGAKPTSVAQAMRMERALRAAEKPAKAPSRSSGGGGSQNTSSPPTASPRPSQRPSQSRSSSGGPARYRQRRDAIGASNPPAQSNTQRVPTGSGVSLSAGPMADRSPSRRIPPRLQTPDAPDRGVNTKQSRYKSPVKKEDIKTFAQWMNLSPEQRKNAGLPSSHIGARRYFAGLK